MRDVAVEDLVVLEDVKSETVTIGLGSLASDFDEFLPEAQKVVDSVKWGFVGGSKDYSPDYVEWVF